MARVWAHTNTAYYFTDGRPARRVVWQSHATRFAHYPYDQAVVDARVPEDLKKPVRPMSALPFHSAFV